MCAHIAIHAISTFQQTFNKAETLHNHLGNDGHKQLYMESVNGVML